MINFRYHLVSIIAVFLALALGIAMGVTVISQGIVDTLEERIDDVEANADEESAQNDQLQSEKGRMEDYLRATAPFVVAGHLDGTAVIAVAARGVDGGAVERTVDLAQVAGADAPGILWLEESFGLTEPDQVEEMAVLLGQPASRPRGVLRRDAWQALAARLAAGPPPYPASDDAPTAPDGSDLLVALADAGFVAYQSVGNDDTEMSDLPEVNARALLVDGAEAAILPDDVVARGTAAMLRAGFPLVVSEVYPEEGDESERGARLAPVRSNDNLAGRASTVDYLEWEEGRITAVLVLGDPEAAGHYGYGAGAELEAPEFSAP